MILSEAIQEQNVARGTHITLLSGLNSHYERSDLEDIVVVEVKKEGVIALSKTKLITINRQGGNSGFNTDCFETLQ